MGSIIMFAQRGLSSRLNIIVIGINFIVLMIVVILANLSSSSALRNQALERFSLKNTEVTIELNTLFSTFIANVESLSEAISNVEDLEDSGLLRNQLLTQLEQMDNQALISRISIARPNQSVGVLFFENPANQTNYTWRVFRLTRDLPTNTIIRQSYETGEPMWFQQMRPYNDDLERPVVSFVYPYRHEQGDSVLWIDVPLTVLHDTVTNALNNRGLLTGSENGYIILVDHNNIPLSLHNVPEVSDIRRTIRSIFDTHAEEHRNADGLFSHADPFNNGDAGLFAINHLDSTDWHIIDVLPENEIPVLPNTVLAPIAVVAITGLIILLIAVNRFIDRSVVQPLVDLGRSATEIGEGNLHFIVFHQDKKDEIGTLSNALDSMRSRLKDSYDELQSWSRTLEERVGERTNQLTIAQERAEENAVQLRAVYDESLSVVNETQLNPVLDTFIERILTLFNATYCAIWLLTPEKQNLQLVATNDSRHRKGEGVQTVNIDEGIIGQVIMQREPLIVDDYEHYEHRLHLAEDETILFIRGVCAPLMFAGQPVGVVVVGRPRGGEKFTLSDQRYLTLFANLVSPSVRNAQLLIQLQAAVDEAHQANEVKTRFLASVTHELRTPLNLIINNMDFMRVGAFGDVSVDQVSRLNQTVRSAEHLLYLINDLLDVSKIEAGEMQLFIQDHEVATLLEDTVDNARAVLDTMENKEEIELHVEIEADLPEIPMDSRRIRQVLNNLLSNAIKFTQKGGVTLKVFKVANGIHFSVHDTGLGIPQEEMAILFAAFERTTAAKQHGIEGTGLGLPISRFLVQQHGTDLTVLSEVGVGSTFAFTLPFVTPVNIPSFRPTDTQQITAILTPKNH